MSFAGQRSKLTEEIAASKAEARVVVVEVELEARGVVELETKGAKEAKVKQPPRVEGWVGDSLYEPC